MKGVNSLFEGRSKTFRLLKVLSVIHHEITSENYIGEQNYFRTELYGSTTKQAAQTQARDTSLQAVAGRGPRDPPNNAECSH